MMLNGRSDTQLLPQNHDDAELTRLRREVARSTFYAWQRRPPSRRAMEDAVLLNEIERIYIETGEAYGSPQMFDDLIDLGCRIGRKRVARLMHLRRLRAQQFQRHRVPASRKASALAPNLVRR